MGAIMYLLEEGGEKGAWTSFTVSYSLWESMADLTVVHPVLWMDQMVCINSTNCAIMYLLEPDPREDGDERSVGLCYCLILSGGEHGWLDSGPSGPLNGPNGLHQQYKCCNSVSLVAVPKGGGVWKECGPLLLFYPLSGRAWLTWQWSIRSSEWTKWSASTVQMLQ